MGMLARILGGTSKAPPTTKAAIDEHGQPAGARINWRRVADRQIDELIGMCRLAIWASPVFPDTVLS